MKRLLASLLAGAYIPLLFWVGGYDFDVRNLEAAVCMIFATFVTLWVYFYPGWTTT